jgi:hypothetical protein
MTQRNASRPVPQQTVDVHQIPITFFDDKFAAVQYRESLTLPQLADEIRYMTDSRKTRLPWLKLALFGDVASAKGCLRTNANTLEITGIEIDYDGGETSFDEAVLRLTAAGLRALIYTSASYQRGVKEKWRVLCPLSQPLPPGDRVGLVGVLNGVLGGGIDPASFNLSIAFYYGSVNENPEHRVEVVDGDFIDCRSDLNPGAIGRTVKQAELNVRSVGPVNSGNSGPQASPSHSDEELEAMLQNSQFRTSDGSGRWHNEMTPWSAAVVCRRWTDHDIYTKAAPFCDAGYADPKLVELVESARAKYGIKDPDIPKSALLGAEVLAAIAKDAPPEDAERIRAAKFDDFQAYLPSHHYVFMPTRDASWPMATIDDVLPRVQLFKADGTPVMTGSKKNPKPVTIKASTWLSRNRPLEQMTWAPGEPGIIRDRLVTDGGWIERTGSRSLNLYRPPVPIAGDATMAGPWVDHVEFLYGDDALHIIKWLAHRAQFPGEKINHALVLGGAPGIGKDSLLEPVKYAVGPWNVAEISPKRLTDKFNGFGRSVILRISEVKDLGEMSRYDFYDRTKTYCAAPPDVLEINEKNKGEYYVFNVCGVVMTTNYKTDGIYLPRDDRRHYVAWSKVTEADLKPGTMQALWDWYEAGGYGHVVAYLTALDISDFDAKATPPKTDAFYDIADANAAPESNELANLLDAMGNPEAVTIGQLQSAGMQQDHEFHRWLCDRQNQRRIKHRLEDCGYERIRSDTSKDGAWEVSGRRVAVYALAMLSTRDKMAAAQKICENSQKGTTAPKF